MLVLGQPSGGSGWWSLRLPFEAAKGPIEAAYTNGMLEVKVVKDASMKIGRADPAQGAVTGVGQTV